MLLPGPDMALVTRFTVAQGAKGGWKAVAGIQLSFLVYSAVILAGAAWVLSAKPWILDGLRIVGGAYLVYLAARGFKEAGQEEAATDAASPFKGGLMSNLLNPKQAIFLAAILPQFVPKAGGAEDVALLLLVLLFVSGLVWGAYIWALLHLRARLQSNKIALERGSVVVLGLVGIALILGLI